MRISAGLGFLGLFGLVAACTTEVVTVQAQPEDPTKSTSATDPSSTDPSTPVGAIVTGLKVKDIAVFQAVKIPIVVDGEESTTKRRAPVVGSRPGIIRVYVTPEKGFKSQTVTAELRLATDKEAFPIIRETKKISGESTEEDADSTFNIEFPATSFPSGVSMQIALTVKGGVKAEDGTANTGRWPNDGGWQDLSAADTGAFKIVIVPIKYTFDGSNRLPTLTDEQLSLYKSTLMGRYPATEVDLTVHEPVAYEAEISGTKPQTFMDLLTFVRGLRAKDKVADDVYYFGQMMPTKTFATFCSKGCVAGLSAVFDDYRTSALRASIGVGYPGQQAADTMAHEVGHAHGRNHAPCGDPDGVDTKYPKEYTDASIGSWGYDMFAKEFISPDKTHDMMSYCPNKWLSDYTYNALAKRISDVAQLASGGGDETATEEPDMVVAPNTSGYSIATLDAAGNTVIERDTTIRGGAITGGFARKAILRDSVGATQLITARFFPYDHVPGGILYIPRQTNAKWQDIAIEGASFRQLKRLGAN